MKCHPGAFARPVLIVCAAVLLAVVTTGSAGTVLAEGSLGPELDTSQALRRETDIFVDVLDFRVETFVWTGRGDVEAFDPTGTSVGTFASGATITPTMNGSYRLDLEDNQYDVDSSGDIVLSTIVPWDVTLSVSGAPRPGRAFSYWWAFNTGSFNQASSTNASFYAKVPGGDTETFAVMELRTDGLAGYIFEIQGNHTGVIGSNAGRSVPETMNSAANEYQIYLNPPDDANYSYLAPTIADLRFQGGLEAPGGVETCDEFTPGDSTGEFSFSTNVDGTFHLVCDINEDGLFDIVDDGDFLALGDAEPGLNRIPFDGVDNSGTPFALGDHECMVRVTVGEFHYVGRDIETSFRGLRMFQIRPDRARTPLDMFWNDALVQMNAITMPAPHAYLAAATSGPMGLNSGDPSDLPVPLGEGVPRTGANARAWGDFGSAGGKGNEAYLDTYTWLDEALSATITIHAVDGTIDTDGEGLPDYVERCITGTDPGDPDTDRDSVDDFEETVGGMPGRDTDSDGLANAVDDDDDGDCVPTLDEDPDGDGEPSSDDTDGNGIPNYLDADDDGDGVVSCDEDRDGDTNPLNDDSDGDGIPDFLEEDSDGDCALLDQIPGIMCLDGGDACPTEPEDPNTYMDEDGCPEPDRDGDGWPDEIDNCPDIFQADGERGDLDDDGLGDLCDDDMDGDGLANGCEIPDSTTCPFSCASACSDDLPDCNGCADTDPMDFDTDDGGSGDGEEVLSRGSDPLNTVDDPLPGDVTGGGIFLCNASPGNGSQGWLILLFVTTGLIFRRNRKGGGADHATANISFGCSAIALCSDGLCSHCGHGTRAGSGPIRPSALPSGPDTAEQSERRLLGRRA